MMACIEGMQTEKAFLATLGQAKKWRISGQQLELFDAPANCSVGSRQAGRPGFCKVAAMIGTYLAAHSREGPNDHG